MCDACLHSSIDRAHPAVLIGRMRSDCRPVMRRDRQAHRRRGLSVLVPNRLPAGQGPGVDDPSKFNFAKSADRELQPLMGSINAPGRGGTRRRSRSSRFSTRAAVDKAKKIGTQATAWAARSSSRPRQPAESCRRRARRFTAVPVTEMPTTRICWRQDQGTDVFRIAANDDMRQPREGQAEGAFGRRKRAAEIEVYADRQHGWCIRDMPLLMASDLHMPDRRARMGQARCALQAALQT